MTISDKGLKLICSFEGFSAKPYPDPGTGAKPYTIGYGTTVYPNKVAVTMQDAPVTKELAMTYVRDHIEKQMASWLTTNLPNLTQNQYDSVCSFIYNIGLGNFKTSSLLADIKKGATNDIITADFNKWTKGGGKVLQGLVKRRAVEAALYCNGTYPV